MAILEAARTYPVLGRFDDYGNLKFSKSFKIDTETGKIEIDNSPNRVNEIAGGQVIEILVVENPFTAKKTLFPISDAKEVLTLDLDKFLGDVSITLMQVAGERVRLESSDSFSDFFSKDSEESSVFHLKPGEILGFGETQHVRIDPSGGSSWLEFSDTGKKGFSFEVSLGAKVVAHVGTDLYQLISRANREVETKHWVTLSYVRSALEIAISRTLADIDNEADDVGEWQNKLRENVQEIGYADAGESVDISQVQKIALSLLEEESVLRVFNSLVGQEGND
jgi:hypothetical protein